jgi:ABC-type multidrug transport system fused ATPase/permease subunit
LWNLLEREQADHVFQKFEPHWEEELRLWKEKKISKPGLFRALRKTFLMPWLGAMALQTIYSIMAFINPVILPFVIEYVSNPLIPVYYGYVYLICIVLATLLGSFMFYYSSMVGSIVGLRVRSVLLLLLYRKVLTLASNKNSNSGQIVNLVSQDAQMISESIGIFNNGFVAPIQIVIAIVLLALQIKVFTVISIGVLILIMPFIAVIGRRFGAIRGLIQKAGDKRLKFTNELLTGIRIVKFYAWENPFVTNIEKYRVEELKAIKSLANMRAVLIFVMSNTITIMIALTFLLYAYLNTEPLTASVAFTTLSLINLLRLPFFWLPLSITFLQQYKIMFNRIREFVVNQPEIELINRDVSEGVVPEIVIKEGDFKWDPKADNPTLGNINVHIGHRELAMVVGAVGSGKSSLLSCLLGEMPRVNGEVTIKGSVAYVPQEAWIMNATIRENILFGEDMDDDKYNRVLDAAALRPDLAILPAGDFTEIGERGITLSGGQKQRVAVARSLYSDRQIYVMDDPLSAVDSHVGKHIFEQAISGYLQGRTIVLATNQLQYLPYASQIILLKDGKIVDSGNFTDLQARCKEFQELISEGGFEKEKVAQSNDTKKPIDVAKNAKKPAGPGKDAAIGKLTKVEEKETGLVSWSIYKYYFIGGGVVLFSLIIGAYAFSIACRVLSSWWLAIWSDPTTQEYPALQNQSITFYVLIYLAWVLGESLFSFAGYLILVKFSINASTFFHQKLLKHIIRAPTSFFDSTPLGRIVNRFAKELSLIDNMLPIQLMQYLGSIFNIFGAFAGMCFASPYIAIAIPVVLVFYIWFERHYRKTSIELQRLEALSRAPIFSHLNETIRGASTIRAYQMGEVFKNVNIYRVNYNTIEKYSQRYVASWFGLRLDWMGAFMVLVTMLGIVVTRTVSPNNIDAGFAGLALTNLGGLTFILSSLSLNAAETETRMNSVERIKEYESLPQEKPATLEEKRPPADWPREGGVEFKNLHMRYRPDTPLVLDDVSVTILPKDKIGIVGRTGAGKSSLMQALFRMVEPESGTIVIDGVDITEIGLSDLRKRLAIIPQDPLLFMGSIRHNLDPFDEHPDGEVWEALEMVQLKEHVKSLETGLEHIVDENGSNFSVGQRQLICMARALLRRAKILVMDEATASVDINTDAVIQKMVRTAFADCTVLTIAHRLNTIMDSSKVLVLDKGNIAEFDTPAKLLEKPEGIFASMVDATGPTVSKYLRKIARGEVTVLDTLQEVSSAEESTKEELIEKVK